MTYKSIKHITNTLELSSFFNDPSKRVELSSLRRNTRILVIPYHNNTKGRFFRTKLLCSFADIRFIYRNEQTYYVKVDIENTELEYICQLFIKVNHTLSIDVNILTYINNIWNSGFLNQRGKEYIWRASLHVAERMKNIDLFIYLLDFGRTYNITRFPQYRWKDYQIALFLEEVLLKIDPHTLINFGKSVINAYIAYRCCYLAKIDEEGTREERKKLLRSSVITGLLMPFFEALIMIYPCPYIAYLVKVNTDGHEVSEGLQRVYKKKNIIPIDYNI